VSNDNDGHHERPVDQPSPDLTYLHPDNLHIGHIGVFAGDWAWTGEPPRIPVGFVGVLIDCWDKSAVWRCTREVAEAVVAEQHRLREAERARLLALGQSGAALERSVDEYRPPVWFDGDDLVLDETALYGEPTIDRQSPGPDGRYRPMGLHWSWIAVDPTDCDHIAGVLPAFGEHREYVMATHQPLRMPHDRLTITALDETITDHGTTSTAMLVLDDEPIGTVRQRPGQSAEFRPTRQGFSQQNLNDFARACRWRGRETDAQTVLRALIAEYRTTRHVAGAERLGLVAVILRDGDDHIVGTDIVLEPRPFAPGDRQTLAELFTGREAARRPSQNQFVWQVWTGSRWQMLGIVDVPRDGSPPGHEVPGTGQTPTMTGSADQTAATTADPMPGAGDGVPETGGTEQNGEER